MATIPKNYNFAQGTCAVKWCPNSRRKMSPYCAACAASFKRANKLGEVWVRMRHDTVSKFQARMVYLVDEKDNKELKNAARQIRTRRF
jgi:hypothetical protein